MRRLGALRRVAILAALIVAAFLVVSRDGLSVDRVRDVIEPAGAWAPLLFVVVGALAVCAMFPGPVLAGAAGVLFGIAGGTAVAVAATSLGAALACTIARRFARREVEAALGDRFAGLRAWVARRGFWAVAASRVAPGLPNHALNYAFGLMQVSVLAVAGGVAAGWGPKAFAYAALGGSLSDLRSPEAVAALVVLAIMGVAGVAVIGRDVRAALTRPGPGAGSSSPDARSAGPP